MSKTSYYITTYVMFWFSETFPQSLMLDVKLVISMAFDVIWFHQFNTNREVQAFNLEDYCLEFIMSADSSKIPVMIMLANYFINSCNKFHINAAQHCACRCITKSQTLIIISIVISNRMSLDTISSDIQIKCQNSTSQNWITDLLFS